MICCLFCRCNIIRSSYQRENVPLVAKVWSCTSQNLVVTSENLHDEFFHFTIKQTREGVLTTEYLDVEDRIGCRLCEQLMVKNSLPPKNTQGFCSGQKGTEKPDTLQVSPIVEWFCCSNNWGTRFRSRDHHDTTRTQPNPILIIHRHNHPRTDHYWVHNVTQSEQLCPLSASPESDYRNNNPSTAC